MHYYSLVYRSPAHKGALCIFTEISIFVDVGLHPWAPIKVEYSEDLFQMRTKLQVKLQIPMVENVWLYHTD